MDSQIAYLRSLTSIRVRSQAIYKKALIRQSKHFHIEKSRLTDVADYVVELIKVNAKTSLGKSEINANSATG